MFAQPPTTNPDDDSKILSRESQIEDTWQELFKEAFKQDSALQPSQSQPLNVSASIIDDTGIKKKKNQDLEAEIKAQMEYLRTKQKTDRQTLDDLIFDQLNPNPIKTDKKGGKSAKNNLANQEPVRIPRKCTAQELLDLHKSVNDRGFEIQNLDINQTFEKLSKAMKEYQTAGLYSKDVKNKGQDASTTSDEEEMQDATTAANTKKEAVIKVEDGFCVLIPYSVSNLY